MLGCQRDRVFWIQSLPRLAPPTGNSRRASLSESTGREPGGCGGVGWCVVPRARALRLAEGRLPAAPVWAVSDIVRYAESSRFVRHSRIHGLQITLEAEVHARPAGFPQRPPPSLTRRCARPCRSLGQRRLSHLDLRRKSRAPPVRLRPRGAT